MTATFHMMLNTGISVATLVGIIMTAVLFIHKLRWEIDALKKENTAQFLRIDKLETEFLAMNSSGGEATKRLEEAYADIKLELKEMRVTLQQLTLDVSLLKSDVNLIKKQ